MEGSSSLAEQGKRAYREGGQTLGVKIHLRAKIFAEVDYMILFVWEMASFYVSYKSLKELQGKHEKFA